MHEGGCVHRWMEHTLFRNYKHNSRPWVRSRFPEFASLGTRPLIGADRRSQGLAAKIALPGGNNLIYDADPLLQDSLRT